MSEDEGEARKMTDMLNKAIRDYSLEHKKRTGKPSELIDLLGALGSVTGYMISGAPPEWQRRLVEDFTRLLIFSINEHTKSGHSPLVTGHNVSLQ